MPKKSVTRGGRAVLWVVVKRTVAGRLLLLAVAALSLVSQVAVVAHIPALHEEEAQSKCRDSSKHFCAEAAPEDSGRCVLCQASLGGAVSALFGSTSEPVTTAESAPLTVRTTPRLGLKFLPAAPRAPPAL